MENGEGSAGDSAAAPPLSGGPRQGPGFGGALPLEPDQLFAASSEQWRTVVDAVVGQVAEQVREGVADVAGQWQQVAQGFVIQLGEQWAQVQRTLAEQLRQAMETRLAQTTSTIADAPSSGIAGPSMEALFGPLIGQANAALARLTEQLNAQFKGTPLEFRVHSAGEAES